MTKVISLFDAKRKVSEEEEESTEGMTFKEIAERNHKNAERLRKERNQANKSVLRSYRIKH